MYRHRENCFLGTTLQRMQRQQQYITCAATDSKMFLIALSHCTENSHLAKSHTTQHCRLINFSMNRINSLLEAFAD